MIPCILLAVGGNLVDGKLILYSQISLEPCCNMKCAFSTFILLQFICLSEVHTCGLLWF